MLAVPTAQAEAIAPQINQELLLTEAVEAPIIHAPTLRDALYFAYLGSAGETRIRLADALGLPVELPEGANVELPHDGTAAQGVWIQPGYGWLESFDQATERDFDFIRHPYDFIHANRSFDGELAEKEIAIDIQDQTRLIFASVEQATYGWRETPLLNKTAPGLFIYGEDDQQVAEFICLVGEFLHYGEDAFQVVGIPLSQKRTLFVWLPNKLLSSGLILRLGRLIEGEALEPIKEDPGWSLDQLLQNLSLEFVRETVARMNKRQIEVRLPLASLKDWNDSLVDELGVVGAHGDFTNLLPGEGNAYIQSIQSEMALDLNAAGVTTSNMAGLVMRLTAWRNGQMLGVAGENSFFFYDHSGRQALPLEFNADRPHLLMIADDSAEDLVAVASVRRIPYHDLVRDEGGSPLKATDWAASAWFGWVLNNPGSQFVRPWYYHAEHGWIYMPEMKAAGTWWYDEGLGWAWSSATFMPWIYSDAHGWLWFSGGVAGERSFYSFEKSGWILEDELRAE